MKKTDETVVLHKDWELDNLAWAVESGERAIGISELKEKFLKAIESSEGLKHLNAWLYGDFTPAPREIDLHKRLELYYRQTPDEMDNRTAMKHWRVFKKWCAERGYTQEEINRAKRNVRI